MNHIKYVQIKRDDIRLAHNELGQILLLVKNYTKLLDEPAQHADGNTQTYRVSVPDAIYLVVNGEAQVNVGVKGDWGYRNEVACLPVESLKPLVEPALAIAQGAQFSGKVIAGPDGVAIKA